MKFRSFGSAVIGFVLGAVAFWAVSTQTTWLLFLQKPSEYRVVDTNTMNWVEGKTPQSTYGMKFLYKDSVTHEVAMLVRYSKGQINPPHLHNYGHGMYVLQGQLVTHKGRYGPGSFVWFPPNEMASHGASADEDCVILFLRHEDMDTRYLPTASK